MASRLSAHAVWLVFLLLVATYPLVARCGEPATAGIRAVDFRNTSVSRCIEILRQETVTMDLKRLTINVVVHLRPEVLRKPVTLNLSGVSWQEAFEELCAKAGARLFIERQAFVIAQDEPDFSQFDTELARKESAAVRARMARIVFYAPEIEDGVTVADVVARLAAMNPQLDPEGVGVPLRLEASEAVGDRPAEPIHLANDASLLELLRYVTYMNGLRIEIRDGGVVLRAAGKQSKPEGTK